ncbi:MAG: extracellular solute-binding protein [Hominilimicola sp.]
MTQTWKKIATVSIAAVMLTGALAGCGSQTVSIDRENPSINVMTKAFQAESAAGDSPVMEELEKFLGTQLNMTWAPSTSYDEKVTTAMGSGTYPHAMLIGTRSSSVIQASRNDIFWDVTDKLQDAEKFPNLAQTNPMVNHNISIDGKVYGLYRARTVGRAGVSIRKDWLDKLGLDIPKTVDDLYNVLKAFTEQDPDGNGQNDTYGMIVTDYLDGPLNNLAIWMGAPNGYGVDENGELTPAFMTDEYMDALNFMRKCYEEGLINADMATYSSDKWNEQFLSGQAGVIIDVADRARRLAQNIQGLNPDAVVDVFGYVTKDENTEPRTLPTTGYDGYYVFPKAAVATEEDLDFVLGVMDKANEQEALNLMNFGIEGRNYELDADGYVVKKEDAGLVKEYADLNQFATGIIPTERKVKYTAEVAEKIDKVYEDNEQYAVANPAEPYVSATYSKKGPQLDAIMAEAKTKYIVGQISEDEYKAEIERWKNMGGADVIKEINEAYKADDTIQK